MHHLIEHLAVAVSAISGVLAARGKRVDLFGVIVLALATALGGGTVRDLCLAVKPVFWVTDPAYVWTAAGTAVATFVVVRFRRLPERFLLVADAFGLALFTIVGMEKALLHHAPGSIAVAMGVVTGVAGGMIRDVLRGEIPLVFRREIYLYATASFAGAVLLLILRAWFPAQAWTRLAAMGFILGLRLGAMQWRLALPVFSHGDPDPDPPHNPA